MEKVILPLEVAKTIERLREIECNNADIVYQFASGEDKENIDFANFAADNFDTLLSALVNGYEVEQTPEDKVREYYNELCGQMPNSHAAQSADTVLIVLNMLGKEIKGVNA